MQHHLHKKDAAGRPITRKRAAKIMSGQQGTINFMLVALAALAKANNGEIIVTIGAQNHITTNAAIRPHFYPNGDVGFRVVEPSISTATEAIKWQHGRLALCFPSAETWMRENSFRHVWGRFWWLSKASAEQPGEDGDVMEEQPD
jgi:hypothetical protein